MLNKLRERNCELIEKFTNENNEKEQSIQLIIQELLKNEKCFFDLSMEESYKILKCLGFSFDESGKIYLKLLESK